MGFKNVGGVIIGGTTPVQPQEYYFTSQSVIVVNHTLGYNPNVNALEANGSVLDNYELVHNTNNTFTITFLTAYSGKVVYF
jgi:hypothetical protein